MALTGQMAAWMAMYLLKDMKHFFAGLGEISLFSFVILSCIGLAPLVHIYVIETEISFGRLLLAFIGISFVLILLLSRLYRKFFYKDSE